MEPDLSIGTVAVGAPRHSEPDMEYLEGVSPSMRPVEVLIGELAQNDVPVLLLAEAGTGKRTAAQRIHQTSSRAEQPFRIVACATLTPEAFDVAGPGTLFTEGTLFLEEVADLNSASQVRLLEALPKVEGNGNGHRPTRLICGSSRDLEAEVRSGRFREDLYYRISGVCLRLPPLRQRRDDIPYLMSFYLAKFSQDFRRTMPVLSPQTKQLFQDYAWPGNIRELEDMARAIVALGDEALAMGGLRAMFTKSDRSVSNGERVSLKQAARAASREAEKELILKVLTRTRWNRRRAAQELQISYKALLYKLKQIGYGEYGAS
ncbi:MAG TPA: sigma 54-interacting transcriptional regulator [Terriglobales bacterium]|nr:sigma 54-interacting transcriptional regulator [Terriglobales bacterium]